MLPGMNGLALQVQRALRRDGGFSLDPGRGMSGTITAITTFGALEGDDCVISGSLKFRF
jgi:hypothetical protein